MGFFDRIANKLKGQKEVTPLCQTTTEYINRVNLQNGRYLAGQLIDATQSFVTDNIESFWLYMVACQRILNGCPYLITDIKNNLTQFFIRDVINSLLYASVFWGESWLIYDGADFKVYGIVNTEWMSETVSGGIIYKGMVSFNVKDINQNFSPSNVKTIKVFVSNDSKIIKFNWRNDKLSCYIWLRYWVDIEKTFLPLVTKITPLLASVKSFIYTEQPNSVNILQQSLLSPSDYMIPINAETIHNLNDISPLEFQEANLKAYDNWLNFWAIRNSYTGEGSGQIKKDERENQLESAINTMDATLIRQEYISNFRSLIEDVNKSSLPFKLEYDKSRDNTLLNVDNEIKPLANKKKNRYKDGNR